MKPRLFAVALHGFCSYYTEPLLAQGKLPNFRSLLARSASAQLISPLPISGATWVTMFTGESAGVHGALDYVQVDARSYHGTDASLADTALYRDRTIFSVLSRAGRRVAALLNPMTYPPWPVNGVMLSGFPLPDDRRPPAWPPELGARLGRIASRRLLTLRYEDKPAIDRYLRELCRRTEEITAQVWRELAPDLLFTCVALPDLAHHYFSDPRDPGSLERIQSIYEEVDAALGRLVALAGPEVRVAVFSDHGGGPAPRRTVSVNRVLINRGLMKARAGAGERAGMARAANWLVQRGRRLRLHEHLRPLLRGRVRDGVLAITHNDAFVDWERTRAYGVEFFFPLAAAEVNLAGRQRRGVVPPGEYERCRTEIAEALAALVDPATGARVCERVCRREEMFHGPHLERIPDVIGILAAGYDAKIQLQPEEVSDNTMSWSYPFLGYHAREGLFAAFGPGIPAGRTLPPADMLDLAPTLLALLESPIPESMEGRPFLAPAGPAAPG